MKNLWSKANFILISFILISSVVSSVSGTSTNLKDNPSHLYQLESNANELSIFNSNLATNYIDDSNPPINKQEIIFDVLLINELATQEQLPK